MSPVETALVALHFLLLAGLSFYGLHRYHLAWLYRRHRDADPSPLPPSDASPTELPRVTVQLPIYNERFVVERLIDAVCALRYPRDRLEIQVLDDSTDDTVDCVRRAVEAWRRRGVNITHVRRADRTGFKAGALRAGMAATSGELLAVFDADFVPAPDFLERTVPYFADPGIGMVQARWEHLNRDESLLTQAQSVLLDGHFILEHTARNRSGRFFNFNGTAGVWRRAAIEEAGGWQHDTLTEDLDLSYRAQLAGWRFVFLRDVTVPAEVPADMNAFKTQQHRWAKGSIQVALKLLPRILRSGLPRAVKFEAFVHLTNNVAYVLMLCLSALMPFVLRVRVNADLTHTLWIDLPILVGATLSVSAFYLYSQREAASGSALANLLRLPVVLGLGIGLAVNNARATLEAAFGHQSPFVRTPKRGDGGATRTAAYRASRSVLPVIELALGLAFADAALYCARHGLWPAIPFMLLFQFGFLYTALAGLLPHRPAPRSQPERGAS